MDLSHTVEDGLVTYRGLPAPLICDYLSREESRKFYAPGTEFQIAKIEMVANTGTYLDCPSHRYADGKDLSQVGLEHLVDLEAIVVHADHGQTLAIGVEFFRDKEIRNRAVLVHTGWDRYWNSDRYFGVHPFLTEEAALYLRECGASLVGIDSLNIDDTRGNARPVHSTLLRAGDPDRGASLQPGAAAGRGIRLQRGPAQVQRRRHLPGAGAGEGESGIAMVDEQTLQQIVKRIVAAAQPSRIILFGS